MGDRNGTLVAQITRDVGMYIQAVATLELELDDLLGLTNSRFDAVAEISRRYPVQLSRKIEAMQKTAVLVGFVIPEAGKPSALKGALEWRQRLVHGKIVDFRATSAGYYFTVVKMTLPKNYSGRQRLVRDAVEFHAQDFSKRMSEINRFREVIEDIRKLVFVAGEGWPNYRVRKEPDPLGLDALPREMAK